MTSYHRFLLHCLKWFMTAGFVMSFLIFILASIDLIFKHGTLWGYDRRSLLLCVLMSVLCIVFRRVAVSNLLKNG